MSIKHTIDVDSSIILARPHAKVGCVTRIISGLDARDANTRHVRFTISTWEDAYGQVSTSFSYTVPRLLSDRGTYRYERFCAMADSVGDDLGGYFSTVDGTYHYSVLVSIDPGHPIHGSYQILRTDNPRCWEGDPHTRRQMRWVRWGGRPHITIAGSHLSPRYRHLSRVLRDMATYTIAVHSREDIVALCQVALFLGVRDIVDGRRVRRISSRYTYLDVERCRGLRVGRRDGETVLYVVGLEEMGYRPMMDIDEFIVDRNLVDTIRRKVLW